MADPPQDPEQPRPQSPGGAQGSEWQRGREPATVQFTLPPEMPPAELEAPSSSQEALAAQGWPQGLGLGGPPAASLGPYEAPRSSLSLTAGYPPSDFPRQAYLPAFLDEEQRGRLLPEQRQPGPGYLFRQLETAFQDAQPRGAQQFTQFGEEAQHGPYTMDDPSLQFSPSELGFLPLDMEVSEPEPRELAVQNAKAYLLRTSIHCDLSL